VTSYDDQGTPVKIDFDYDQYGNVTNKREYGFQVGGSWQVRRRLNYSYKTDADYINRHMLRLTAEEKIYDALANAMDADDVLITKRAYTYDDYAATGGMVNPGPLPHAPGHDSAAYTATFTWRGNITGVTEWTSIASNTSNTRLRKYDRFGNVVQEQVSCCKQKVFTYTAVDYWASPQEVTNGDPAALNLKSAISYDFNTGLPKWKEYENMGKTHYSYDAALRLIEEEYPGGASDTAHYDDGAMSATFTNLDANTRSVVYDGWGRVIEEVDRNDGQMNTAYDAMGRMQSKTNPFTAGGTPGPSTTFTYDVLGRNLAVTLPDGKTLSTGYSGNISTSTDEVGRQKRYESDGLGRLMKVTEQDGAGVLGQETSYSYSLLDQLTEVNQGGQSRKFKYDDLGRLLYEKIPEQTASINDGTGAMWTAKYTYTDFHAVETRKDARGVVTTYVYDLLNRLTGIGYNVTNAPGVAATDGVGYTYDTVSNSATKGFLLSISKGSYVESYSYNTLKQVSAVGRTINGTPYTTNYAYDSARRRRQITYPSGREVNINRDSKARLISLTDQNVI